MKRVIVIGIFGLLVISKAEASVSGSFSIAKGAYSTSATQFSTSSRIINHGLQLQAQTGKATQFLVATGGDSDYWGGVSSSAGGSGASATLSTNDLGSMTATACSKNLGTFTASTSGRSQATSSHPDWAFYCCGIGGCTPTSISFSYQMTADGTYHVSGCAGAPINGVMICSGSNAGVCGPVLSPCS